MSDSVTEPTALAPRLVRPARTTAYAVGALAAGLVVGLIASPDPARLLPPAPVAQPVVTTTFVCPDFRSVAGVSSTTIVATVPAGVTETTPGPGKAALLPLTRKGTPKPLGTITAPGGAAVISTKGTSTGPVVGAGTGGLAPGLSAGQLTVARTGTIRGLAGVDCADVASDQWFLGGGSASGQGTALVLVNAEVTAATVDIELAGSAGPIDAPGGLGVIVPARSTRVVSLDTLAPGRKVLATHVSADIGRLAMALRTNDRVGLKPRGLDYVPPSASPSRRLVIPAMPAGTGNRQLMVLAPGNDDADVTLSVLGKSGSFSPAGADRFTAPAGTLKLVDLSRVLESEDSALLIESTAPIVAGARVVLAAARKGDKVDYAWSTAVPPITSAAVETTSKVGDGYSASLILSSVGGPSKVQVQTGAPGRKLTSRTVTIAQDVSVTIAIGVAGGRGNVITIVRPLEGSASVWAGRVQKLKATDGTMMTISPLRDARISVEVPQAVPDLSAAVPGR